MDKLDERILDAVIPGWKGKNQMPTPNFVRKIKDAVKDLVQECKPEPEIECVCGEYGTEDCDKVWHMRMCGIDGYEQNILKALEEK